MSDLLSKAKSFADSDPEESMRLCNQVLTDQIDTEEAEIALFIIGYIMLSAERFGLAYHIFSRYLELRPNSSEAYMNLGLCLKQSKHEKALRMFAKAETLDPTNVDAIVNKGLMHLKMGNPSKCIEACDKALTINPTFAGAIHNRGLARLMLRDWGGWKDYHDTLGIEGREGRHYGLKQWDGKSPFKKIIVYGEQGLGDEIMFASCLPDLLKHGHVVFDCDRRLASVFQRSFPDLEVYGTRFDESSPIIDDHGDADFEIAIGQLPYFFRKSDADYPRTPYLKADPERVTQWASLLSDNKRIGVAFSGGLPNTGQALRTACVTDFEPLLEKKEFQFVNLDYVKLEKASLDFLEYYNVKTWNRAILKGCDLEETFALIQSLDAVVTVCTSIVYICGSLGVPCYVLVPSVPSYRYHSDGDDFKWYDSVKLIRGKFEESITKCLEFL